MTCTFAQNRFSYLMIIEFKFIISIAVIILNPNLQQCVTHLPFFFYINIYYHIMILEKLTLGTSIYVAK